MALIKYGNVVEVLPELCRVRVEFPEDDMVSFPLPVVLDGSKDNKYFRIFDIGERVVCLMDQRCEHGAVIGAIYDTNNKPAGGSADVNKVEFSDGTKVSYNRSTSNLLVEIGTTKIEASPAGVEISHGAESVKGIFSDLIDQVLQTIYLSPESGAPNTMDPAAITAYNAIKLRLNNLFTG